MWNNSWRKTPYLRQGCFCFHIPDLIFFVALTQSITRSLPLSGRLWFSGLSEQECYPSRSRNPRPFSAVRAHSLSPPSSRTLGGGGYWNGGYFPNKPRASFLLASASCQSSTHTRQRRELCMSIAGEGINERRGWGRRVGLCPCTHTAAVSEECLKRWFVV